MADKDGSKIREDPKKVAEEVVNSLKSQGLFDQFRKECLEELENMEAYRLLKQRVENHVASFLSKYQWSEKLSKNSVRDSLRSNINQSEVLLNGIDRLIDQMLLSKTESFSKRIAPEVDKYLGIEKKDELRLGSDIGHPKSTASGPSKLVTLPGSESSAEKKAIHPPLVSNACSVASRGIEVATSRKMLENDAPLTSKANECKNDNKPTNNPDLGSKCSKPDANDHSNSNSSKNLAVPSDQTLKDEKKQNDSSNIVNTNNSVIVVSEEDRLHCRQPPDTYVSKALPKDRQEFSSNENLNRTGLQEDSSEAEDCNPQTDSEKTNTVGPLCQEKFSSEIEEDASLLDHETDKTEAPVSIILMENVSNTISEIPEQVDKSEEREAKEKGKEEITSLQMSTMPAEEMDEKIFTENKEKPVLDTGWISGSLAEKLSKENKLISERISLQKHEKVNPSDKKACKSAVIETSAAQNESLSSPVFDLYPNKCQAQTANTETSQSYYLEGKSKDSTPDLSTGNSESNADAWATSNDYEKLEITNTDIDKVKDKMTDVVECEDSIDKGGNIQEENLEENDVIVDLCRQKIDDETNNLLIGKANKVIGNEDIETYKKDTVREETQVSLGNLSVNSLCEFMPALEEPQKEIGIVVSNDLATHSPGPESGVNSDSGLAIGHREIKRRKRLISESDGSNEQERKSLKLTELEVCENPTVVSFSGGQSENEGSQQLSDQPKPKRGRGRPRKSVEVKSEITQRPDKEKLSSSNKHEGRNEMTKRRGGMKKRDEWEGFQKEMKRQASVDNESSASDSMSDIKEKDTRRTRRQIKPKRCYSPSDIK